jgi:hypothetical protein
MSGWGGFYLNFQPQSGNEQLRNGHERELLRPCGFLEAE